MSLPRWSLLAALVAAAALLAALPSRGASEEEARDVRVINFPQLQQVAGGVTVTDPVPQAALISLVEVEVPPIKPDDPRRLINAGSITTDGFINAVLSLSVEARGYIATSGEIGAILVPEEEPIQKVLEERGQVQFPLEVRATPPLRALYFTSAPTHATVAFPRYRVLLYNATDKTVKVNLFAYLTG